MKTLMTHEMMITTLTGWYQKLMFSCLDFNFRLDHDSEEGDTSQEPSNPPDDPPEDDHNPSESHPNGSTSKQSMSKPDKQDVVEDQKQRKSYGTSSNALPKIIEPGVSKRTDNGGVYRNSRNSQSLSVQKASILPRIKTSIRRESQYAQPKEVKVEIDREDVSMDVMFFVFFSEMNDIREKDTEFGELCVFFF